MKLLLLTTLIALTQADVSHLVGEQSARILHQELDSAPDGQYQFSYETENGIRASERGALSDGQAESAGQVAQGEASWTSPEGEQISLQYVADENGYQPQGSHLPTPPPIPPEIIRALEYIRAHPPPPEN